MDSSVTVWPRPHRRTLTMLLLSFYGQIAIILFCSLLLCSVPAQLQQSQILRKLRPAPRERGSWWRCQVTGCKGKDQHPSHEPPAPCSMFSVGCVQLVNVHGNVNCCMLDAEVRLRRCVSPDSNVQETEVTSSSIHYLLPRKEEARRRGDT